MPPCKRFFFTRPASWPPPSGFCVRTSPLTAAAWVQGLVFGWVANPCATESELARSVARAGVLVSPQAVVQRFGRPGARLLESVLHALTTQALSKALPRALSRAHRRWLESWDAIWIRDSTIIALPDSFADEFPASGAKAGQKAALKVLLQWEWHSSALAQLHLCPSRDHDKKASDQAQKSAPPVASGEMHLFDLGFFSLRFLAQLEQKGAFYCCRYKTGTFIFPQHNSYNTGDKAQDKALDKAQDKALDKALGEVAPEAPEALEAPEAPEVGSSAALAQWLERVPARVNEIDCAVLLGKKARLPARLVAVRVPAEVAQERREEYLAASRRKGQKASATRLALCGWNLLLTNAPLQRLSVAQARVLYGMRWQIERLFRVWKETLKVDEWRTNNPERIRCEILAKLIGAVLVHQLTAFCAGDDPARSWGKCAAAISEVANALLIHLPDDKGLRRILQALKDSCRLAAQTQRRAKQATFQRIQNAQPKPEF